MTDQKANPNIEKDRTWELESHKSGNWRTLLPPQPLLPNLAQIAPPLLLTCTVGFFFSCANEYVLSFEKQQVFKKVER